MSEFFAMGGYGGFIWPAYAAAGLVLGALALQSVRAYRSRRDALQRLRDERGATGGRRR